MEAGGVGLQQGTGNDTWEFGVHCHVRVRFDDLVNNEHFLFNVFFPHFADFQRFPVVARRRRQWRNDRRRISEKIEPSAVSPGYL